MNRTNEQKKEIITSYLEREQATYLGAVATAHRAEQEFRVASDQMCHSKAIIDDLLLDLSELLDPPFREPQIESD